MGPRQASSSLFDATQSDLELPALTYLSSAGGAGLPPQCFLLGMGSEHQEYSVEIGPQYFSGLLRKAKFLCTKLICSIA